MTENNEISTGPGRWSLGVPNAYGNAVFVPEPTSRLQKWGAAHDMSSTKTDVESDLWNLARPTTKTVCGQYNPFLEKPRTLTPMTEGSFPEVHARLVDPPCTLRASGWNRWNWLYENPQENVAIPFEWALDSRHLNKDSLKNEIMAYKTGATPTLPVGVPVPRQPRMGDPSDFTDQIPGVSQKLGQSPPPYMEKPRGGSEFGTKVANAPPVLKPTSSERKRAIYGQDSIPEWFKTD